MGEYLWKLLSLKLNFKVSCRHIDPWKTDTLAVELIFHFQECNLNTAAFRVTQSSFIKHKKAGSVRGKTNWVDWWDRSFHRFPHTNKIYALQWQYVSILSAFGITKSPLPFIWYRHTPLSKIPALVLPYAPLQPLGIDRDFLLRARGDLHTEEAALCLTQHSSNLCQNWQANLPALYPTHVWSCWCAITGQI